MADVGVKKARQVMKLRIYYSLTIMSQVFVPVFTNTRFEAATMDTTLLNAVLGVIPLLAVSRVPEADVVVVVPVETTRTLNDIPTYV